jgi:hypothetical protein
MGEGGRRADLLAAPSSPREITTSSCGAPGGVAVEEDEAGGLRSDGGAGALRTDGGERRASSSGRKRPEATRRPERERADMWAHFCKGKEVHLCAAVCWRQRNKISMYTTLNQGMRCVG